MSQPKAYITYRHPLKPGESVTETVPSGPSALRRFRLIEGDGLEPEWLDSAGHPLSEDLFPEEEEKMTDWIVTRQPDGSFDGDCVHCDWTCVGLDRKEAQEACKLHVSHECDKRHTV